MVVRDSCLEVICYPLENSMKKALSLILAIGFLATLSGCDLFGLGEPIVGKWTLYSATNSGNTVKASDYGAWTITIAADNSCSMTMTASGTTSTVTGTWVKAGGAYNLTFNGVATTFTIDSGVLTATSSGTTLRFKKG